MVRARKHGPTRKKLKPEDPILDWPDEFRPPGSRAAPGEFRELRLEVDLIPEMVLEPRLRILERLEELLRERQIEEAADLLRLTARALHGFEEAGFLRVDHWEVDPGGWLPLPEPVHRRREEPIAHLLRALEDDSWQGLAARRSFSVRLSGRPAYRADVVVRRLHRERSHALSIELRGRVVEQDVRSLLRSLGRSLPVLRGRVVATR